MKNKFSKRMGLSPIGSKPRLNGHTMKKRNIIVLAAIMVIGCGVFYAVDSGYVRFGIPAQADANTFISEASEPQGMEHQPISSVAQTDLNAQAQQPTPTQPREAKKEVLKASASSAPEVPKAIAVTGIAFGKATDLTLNIGNTNRRSATTTPAGQPVTYASGDPTVATVAADGTVTCLAVGKTEITAKSGSVKASYNLTVAAPTPTTSTSARQEQDVHTVDTEALALEAFQLINAERSRTGLSKVAWDEDLYACALIRAQEISVKFGHERPNPPIDSNATWPENANGVGIYNAPSIADEIGIPHNWIMENAASGPTTAEAVIAGWMKSSGHRDNLLRSSHTRCAIGVYSATNANGLYWIVWFDDYDGNIASNSTGGSFPNDETVSSESTSTNSVTYSLNATNLSLTAGEGYQLSVEPAGDDAQVAWSAPSLADGILSVDDSGYVTTYYRDGMTSAKATITVSAKVTAPGKSTKTLHCKIIVTQ